MTNVENPVWTVRTALREAAKTLCRDKSSVPKKMWPDKSATSKKWYRDKSATSSNNSLSAEAMQDMQGRHVSKSGVSGVAPSIATSSDIAASEAATLLAACMGVDKTQLALLQEEVLSPKIHTAFERYLERRALGEPLQYITGEAPFRHLTLKASPAALIPRPETEMLVEIGLARLLDEHRASAQAEKDSFSGDTLCIADVGTGTGNIALSLLQELSEKGQAASVYASDISSQALALAEGNARSLFGKNVYMEALTGPGAQAPASPKTAVHDSNPSSLFFLQSDVLHTYPKELKGAFDAIFSNPPYLSSKIMEMMLPAEVKDYEPALALEGGPDGLDVFRRLQAQAPTWLKQGGWLFVELGEENVEAAAEYLENCRCWNKVRVTKDLTGRPRFLSAQCASANFDCPLQ